MKKKISFVIIGCLVVLFSQGQDASSEEDQVKEKKWLIEPVKITSLMVNTHPAYNGWGLEVGRKVTDKLWFTSMIEKTKGNDFVSNFDPNFDFLIDFKYFAWLNTFRYYVKPNAKYTTFFDAGVEFQSASHAFLRNGEIFKEDATALGPILFVGGELQMFNNIYFKWRSGGFINVLRNGSFKSRIDDGQDQPSFFLYPHLSDAVIGKGTYAGDVAFGIKF